MVVRPLAENHGLPYGPRLAADARGIWRSTVVHYRAELTVWHTGVNPLFSKLFGKKQEEKSADDLKLEQSLQKTRSGILGRIGTIFQENQITDELWEALEEILIMGDVGMTTTAELIGATQDRVQRENVKATNDAYLVLKQEMVKLLQTDEPLHIEEPRILTVVLVVGVNGSGKTTSIGKMAYYYNREGCARCWARPTPFGQQPSIN